MDELLYATLIRLILAAPHQEPSPRRAGVHRNAQKVQEACSIWTTLHNKSFKTLRQQSFGGLGTSGTGQTGRCLQSSGTLIGHSTDVCDMNIEEMQLTFSIHSIFLGF